MQWKGHLCMLKAQNDSQHWTPMCRQPYKFTDRGYDPSTNTSIHPCELRGKGMIYGTNSTTKFTVGNYSGNSWIALQAHSLFWLTKCSKKWSYAELDSVKNIKAPVWSWVSMKRRRSPAERSFSVTDRREHIRSWTWNVSFRLPIPVFFLISFL